MMRYTDYTKEDLMRMLESLTPGGSEFHQSPENCARFIRERKGKPKPAAASLLAIVERIEGIADSEIDCPFCGVIGDRDHRRDCLVNEARAAIAAAKATA